MRIMKVCPNCGGTHFVVIAHVAQEWLVDGEGYFEELMQDCIEVTHDPDDRDIWECHDCGYEAEGVKFNVEE